MVRGGRHVGDRTFFPRHADAAQLQEVVPAFLEQHYVERPVPPTIVVPEAIDHAALAEVLTAQAGQPVEIVGNPGGERRVWLEDGAPERRLRDQPEARAEGHAGRPPRGAAGGARPARVGAAIECFDVSHTMGERAVASCVIFDRHAMQTSEYRRFNVTPAAAATITPRCARR